MKTALGMTALFSLMITACNQVERREQMNQTIVQPTLTPEDMRKVSPALEHYKKNTLEEDLWKRSDLSSRDRSVVTVAALIARNQSIDMPHQIGLALDNGVKPSEISEIITHLAFYSGWSNAMSAVAVARDVFQSRGIGAEELPPASGYLLPI